jgi:hypothetical protein
MSARHLATALVLASPLVSAPSRTPPAPQNPFAAHARPEHALLKKLAGKWTSSFDFKMPGIPSKTSHGTEVCEMLGELWVVSRYDDPAMMGGAFAGAQLLGYDPDAEAYVAAWADSESSNLSMQKGTYDAATKTSRSPARARTDDRVATPPCARSSPSRRRPSLRDLRRPRPGREGDDADHDPVRARALTRARPGASRGADSDSSDRRGYRARALRRMLCVSLGRPRDSAGGGEPRRARRMTSGKLGGRYEPSRAGRGGMGVSTWRATPPWARGGREDRLAGP